MPDSVRNGGSSVSAVCSVSTRTESVDSSEGDASKIALDSYRDRLAAIAALASVVTRASNTRIVTAAVCLLPRRYGFSAIVHNDWHETVWS